MPKSFLDKLNTLVKAHINNVIDPVDEETSKSRRKALSRQDIRGGLQRDVKLLRQRINEALEYQDGLQGRADQLYQEIADWDQKADAAVNEGRENDARFAIERMQQAQRELEIIEADLEEHRTITQELISQVNMLDSTLEESSTQGDEAEEQDIPVRTSSQPSTREIGEQIVTQLDNTRRRLSDLISDYTARVTGESPQTEVDDNTGDDEGYTQRSRPTQHPVNRRDVDDDYSARISRLSKPEKPDDKK